MYERSRIKIDNTFALLKQRDNSLAVSVVRIPLKPNYRFSSLIVKFGTEFENIWLEMLTDWANNIF